VQAIRFAPDGRSFLSAGDDGEILVWDLALGEVREPLSGHTGRVTGLEITGDGRTAVSVGLDASAIAWDLAGDRRLGRPFTTRKRYIPDYPPVLAVSPDGRSVAVGEAAGTVALFDAQTLRRRRIAALSRGPVTAAAFSPDGRRLAVTGGAGESGRVTVVDPATGRRDGSPVRVVPQVAQALAFSPDGRQLVVAQAPDGVVRSLDLRRRRPGRLRFQSGPIAFWVAFSPDGERLAVAADDRGTEIRDARTGRRVARLPTEEYVRWATFSPDGRHVATGQFDGEVQLWSTQDWKPVGGPLKGHEGFILTIGFSPDSRTMATSSTDGTVVLWDVETRRRIGSALPTEGGWTSAAFTPAGRHLFAVTDRGTGLRWDGQGEPVHGRLVGARVGLGGAVEAELRGRSRRLARQVLVRWAVEPNIAG